MTRHEPEVAKANIVAVCVADEDWFAAHPARHFRMRVATAEEQQMVSGRCSASPPLGVGETAALFALIAQDRRGWHHVLLPIRVPLGVTADQIAAAATEQRCRALWNRVGKAPL